MDIFTYAYENNLSKLQQIIDFTNVKDERGKTLLHYAVLGSALDVIDYLLSQDINVNAVDERLESSLFDCARKAKVLIAKKLLNRYAKLDLANLKGETILHLACHNGNLDMVKLLVEKGANFKAVTTESKLPIHYAILAGHLNIVNYLLEETKIELSYVDENKNTFLHYAAKTTNEKMIEFFIENHLDINSLNANFETPLFNAVRNGTVYTVELFLKNNSYIEILNRRFETPTIIADIEHRNDILDCLKAYEEKPVYINLISKNELILAVLNRNNEELRRLILNGSTLQKDFLNKTALDYAKQYKFNIAEALLRQIL